MAQIKQTEALKAIKDDNYPVQLKRARVTTTGAEDKQPRHIMTTTRKELQEGGRTKQAERNLYKMSENSVTKPLGILKKQKTWKGLSN